MKRDAYHGTQVQPLPQGTSWQCTAGSTARCDFFWHAHQACELIVFHSGHCHYRIGASEGLCKAPVAFLLMPGVPHAFWTDGFLPGGQELGMDLLWFAADAFSGLEGRTPECVELAHLWSGARRGLRFTGTAAILAHERLRGSSGLSGLRGVALTLDVLALLAQYGGEPVSEAAADGALDHGDLDRLRAVESWLRAHFREPVTLPQCAAATGMGVTTLNTLLKRHYRKTYLEFLSEIRLQRAREDLLYPDRSILTIALATGFGSVATFNRRFRQSEGVGPQVWRENQQHRRS